MMSSPTRISDAQSRVRQVFDFLKAFYGLRNKTILHVSEYPWSIRLSDIPDHESVWLARDSDILNWNDEETDSIHEENEEEHDNDSVDNHMSGTLCIIGCPKLQQPPNLPEQLENWIESGWDDPSSEPSYRNEIERNHPSQDQVNTVVETVYFDDDNSRLLEWDAWLEKRSLWAEKEKPARKLYATYERIFRLYQDIQKEPETYDLILGDGIIVTRNKKGDDVRHPLLLRKVNLSFDPHIPQFTISETDTDLELNTELLYELDITAQVISQIEGIFNNNIHPLVKEPTNTFLNDTTRIISPGGTFIPEYAPVRSTSDEIVLGRDAVLFQRRKRSGYSRAIDNILDDLSNNPLDSDALARIVGGFEEESENIENGESAYDSLLDQWRSDLFLTKDANIEQIDILKFLEQGSHVLVQGPPGTGKTHTIGNIIGHLLAHGKRVLVTGQTTKALEEVRDSVVEPLRPLCVSVLGGDALHKAQMQQSVDHITSQMAGLNEKALERDIKNLLNTREDRLNQLKEVQRRLVHAIGQDKDPMQIGDKEWSPIEAADYVRSHESSDGWITDQPALVAPIPLTPEEIYQLYGTNDAVSEDTELNLKLELPDPNNIISPDYLSELSQELIPLESLTLEEHEFNHSAVSDVFSDTTHTSDAVRVLINEVKTVSKSLNEYLSISWSEKLVSIGCELSVDKDGTLRPTELYKAWQELLAISEDCRTTKSRYEAAKLRFDPLIPTDQLTDQTRKTIEEILKHLRSGSRISKWHLFRYKHWSRLISTCSINATRPQIEDDFQALLDFVALTLHEEVLLERWSRYMQQEDLSYLKVADESDKIQIILDRVDLIKPVLAWYKEMWLPLRDKLICAGVNIDNLKQVTDLGDSEDIPTLKLLIDHALTTFLDVQHNKIKRDELLELLKPTILVLKNLAVSNQEDLIVVQLLKAIEARDVTEYQKLHTKLQDVYALKTNFTKRQELLSKLQGNAPNWAEEIRTRSGLHSNPEPPSHPSDAWLWAQLNHEVQRRLEESVPGLQQKSQELEIELSGITSQVVEKKSWLALKQTLHDTQLQALNGWKQIQSRIGRGTGIRVPSLRREARNLMPQCQSAVPVWIMPLTTLAETFNPAESKFDVVIIDEASQVDLMGLIPWYMAKQVLIVGDDQQVTPEDPGIEQGISDELINLYLKDIPSSSLYDGRASVYELASVSFNKKVRLTDHFRCVEPIINFSSQLSYDGDLQCLRDITDSPVGPHAVEINVQGISENDQNEREAIEIASLMMSCIEQPEYQGLTFGMISMRGTKQHQVVQDLLARHLEPETFEERKILCGRPAHFQGAERNVVFISLVDSPSPDGRPIASQLFGQRDLYKKRFNVAASRAKDQMWVIHSLDPGKNLRGYSEDIRARLILHARNSGQKEELVQRVENNARSPFETAVAGKLISAGYNVVAAWPVGKLEIDLVVIGHDNKMLAIECDSERYHPPEKITEDLYRQRILERRGWTFERIRGMAFYKDSDSALSPIFSKLDSMGIHPADSDDTYRSERENDHKPLYNRVITRAEALRTEWAADGKSIPSTVYNRTRNAKNISIGRTTARSQSANGNTISDTRVLASDSRSIPETSIPSIVDIPTRSSNVDGIIENEVVVTELLGNVYQPYTKAMLTREGNTELRNESARKISRLIFNIVEVEGPVHLEVITDRLRECYGLGSVKGSTRDLIMKGFQHCLSEKKIMRLESFVWISEDQIRQGPRTPVDSNIEHISPWELSFIVQKIANDLISSNTLPKGTGAVAQRRSLLITKTSQDLGFRRVGARLARELEKAIDGLVDQGVLPTMFK